MIGRLSFWVGILLIVGSYVWELSGSLQHDPNAPFPFLGFLTAVNGFTLFFWVVGGFLMTFSGWRNHKADMDKSPASRKRGRFPVVTCILAALFAVPAVQPLIWADKTASPFGSFAEPVCLIGIAAEILCLVALVLRLRRKVQDPS